MPQRSWLAKAKSIHDLGGHFYVNDATRPWNDRRDELAMRKWDAHWNKPVPVDEKDKPYYNSAMHDATVLGIERQGSILRIRLDAIDASDFSHYLADVLEVPAVKAIWPIDLVLHDVTYVRAAREEKKGGLRFVDWERIGKTKGGSEPEFLYDWFFEQEGRLQWIAQLWPHPEHRIVGPNDVFLMVDCARATAEDRCTAAFAQAYGAGAALLYADARAGIDDNPIDFNVFDSPQTEDYIRRRMAAHGLTREEMRP